MRSLSGLLALARLSGLGLSLARLSGLGLSLLELSGCRQVIGVEDRAVERPTDTLPGVSASDAAEAPADSSHVSSSCGPLGFPSAACAGCMGTSCCAAVSTCAESLACSTAFKCLLACRDGACRSRCENYFPPSDELTALLSCRSSSCSAACQISCGGLPFKIPDCETCANLNCCSSAAQCARNAACISQSHCVQACFGSSPGCAQECETRNPQGMADWTVLNACLNSGACAEVCSRQGSWECVDSLPRNLTTPVGAATVSFTVANFAPAPDAGATTFAGTSVRACSMGNVACDGPAATTDASGVATLNIPLSNFGYVGHFELGSEGGNYPGLLFPNPPYMISGWQGRVRFLSMDLFNMLASATVRGPLDAARGHLAVHVRDCNGVPAPGISLVVDIADAQSRAFYFSGSYPSINATKTDQSGIAGVLNLPISDGVSAVAFVRLLQPDAGSREIGHVGVLVKPERLTTVLLPPTFD